MSDMVSFARDLATDTQAYIARYVTKALGSVTDRLGSLEQRVELVSRAPGPPGEPGPAGRDADLNLIAELKAEVAMLKAAIEARPWPDSATMSKTLGELVTAEVARMPVPRDGRDVDVAMLQAFLEAAAVKAVAVLPVPKSGRDGLDGKPGADGRDGVDAVGLPGPPGPAGRDGASVTAEELHSLIDAAVTQAVAALPPVPGPAGPAGEKGADGCGLMDAFTDRAGHLVVTFTDGHTKDVGLIVGKDVDPAEVVRLVTDVATKTLDAWPRPKDGADGADGLGFDDLTFEHDDAGRLYLKFVKGTITKRVRVPGLVDLKVWRAGVKYFKGDAVTHNRSLFLAQVDHPTGRPEDASGDWRLAVMRGRDAAQPKKVEGDE